MQTRTQKVEDYFNETDRYLRNNLIISLRSRLLKENLPDLKNKYILDIGSGNGDLTLPYIKDNKITFLDLSDKMLEIVRSKIPKESYQNGEFINIDLDKFVHTKKYNYVFMIGVLAYVNSLENTFSKLEGLLDDNGTLIIEFTNSRNIITIAKRLIYKVTKMFGNDLGFNMNNISFQEIKKELRKNKLEYNNLLTYWPPLPGFRLLPKSNRNFIYYKLLNSKLLMALGSEIILFISKVND